MKFFDLFKKVLNEEKHIPGTKYAIVCDIDDCLVRANPNIIKMYRKLPTDKQEVELTTAEFAKEKVTPENKKFYDYRDFDDSYKVYASIASGTPIIQNLKALDDFVKNGADVYFLTARGLEDTVWKALNAFLKIRKGDKLVGYKIPRENVFAINDKKGYPGATDAEKKKNVFRKLASKYDYVYMIDDDPKNLARIQELKKESPELDKKVRTIDAKKNSEVGTVRESVSFKEYLIEMALKDVSQEIIDAINAKNYDKALILYFDKVKTQDAYAGLANVKDAFKKMLTFGIVRTFGALEKKGTIPEGSAAALKSHGISNIENLINGMEYTDNPDYVAPKKAPANIERKKLLGNSEEHLKERLKEAKADGWKCNDETPRLGHYKAGDFYYVYISRPKKKIVSEDVILEMAEKDITPDIVNDIQNKDFEGALRKYFNKIKDTATYAEKGSNVAAFDHMCKYGLTRSFKAAETKGKIPEGTTTAIKNYANSHKAEIVAGLEEKHEKKSDAKKVEEPKEEIVPDSTDNAELKKIAENVKFLKKLMNEVEDYQFSSKEAEPFIVDTRANGENGTRLGAKKPKYSDTTQFSSMKTDSERYIEPLLRFRSQFIPKYIQAEADKDIHGDDLKNLKKAERLGQEYVEATKNRIYASYFVKRLNDIILGFDDLNKKFKEDNISDSDEKLNRIKEDATFNYSEFKTLTRWLKARAQYKDKKRAEADNGRKQAPAALPPEINKIRHEYISFLNELERAKSDDDKLRQFLSDNMAAEKAAIQLGISAKPVDDLKKFAGSVKPENNKDLVPTLKDEYSKRFYDDFDDEYAEQYKLINKYLDNLAKLNSEQVNDVADALTEVFMDRLAGVDILVKTANSAALNQAEKAAERYLKIKKNYEDKVKSGQIAAKQSKFVYNPKDKKYDKYYDPEGDEQEKKETMNDMRQAVNKAIDSIDFDKMVQNKMQAVKLNARLDNYSDEEIKELYTALKQGDEAFFNLLKTSKFKQKKPDREK